MGKCRSKTSSIRSTIINSPASMSQGPRSKFLVFPGETVGGTQDARTKQICKHEHTYKACAHCDKQKERASLSRFPHKPLLLNAILRATGEKTTEMRLQAVYPGM